eukprot:PhM_4_TR4023/c0_g1_i1/m.47024
MQAQRNSMRFRVAQRFARVPGQHGDGYIPAYYPVFIQPTIYGGPWYKPIDGTWSKCAVLFFVVLPWTWYAFYFKYMFAGAQRIHMPGRVPAAGQALYWFNDQDDPDFDIKMGHLKREMRDGDLNTFWGGTNFMASYLWEPGDPEPDIRRKEPPSHAH